MKTRLRTLAPIAVALLALLVFARLVALDAARVQGRGGAPQRIISLVPAVTEMLFALGVGDRVVAVSSFDRFPPEVERLPRVGALLDPDVERILSLRPDLVVIYRSQNDLLAQLTRAQIPPFLYAHAGLAGITSTLRRVGETVGAAARADELARGIDARIEKVRTQNQRSKRPRVLIVFARESFALRGVYASGGIGFVHDMLAAAGGDNVFADIKREAVQATTEQIIVRKPDVILELRADPMDAATQTKELQTWKTLSAVPAVRNNRVHIIVDPRTVIPGPRVAEGVQLLSEMLHEPR